MKVLHLISGGDVGGAKTHVHSLLKGLNRTITAHLACFLEGDFSREARELGIPVTVIRGNPVAAYKKLKAMVREDGYEIVHCHGSKANMFGALLKRGLHIPVCSTVHSDPRLDYLGRPLSRLTFGVINSVALRRLDYRICVSDPMAETLIGRGFDPERVFTIYNGLDFTPREPEMSREEYFRSVGLSFDENSVVAGIAARLSPVKDVATLIRGFTRAAERDAKLRLIIAGDGEQKDELKSLALSLGQSDKICFAGWVADTTSFYGAIDINTLTSLSETFPYALTEGARMHRATVATRVGGIPVLIDHGINGLLFAPGDDQALCEHLLRLSGDAVLRRSMGERLHEKASRQFSEEATCRKQHEIYGIIKRRSTRPKRKRDGVTVCGAYGKGNAGDDAILEAVVGELRSIDPDIPITVLSRNPVETRINYRVGSVHTFDIPGFLRAMRHSDLYINGGGSLIQDVTSTRSLYYYLYNIAAARRAGTKVLMYGCGIGPVSRPRNRRLAARVMNKYVHRITLREPNSMEELKKMGVTRPEIILSADPTLTLTPASPERTDSAFLAAGLDPNGKYIAFALRSWPGFEEKAPLFARAADYVRDKYGLTPLFIPMEKKRDIPAGEQTLSHMKGHGVSLLDTGDAGVTIGILSRMQAVVSMRLHALVFAAGRGVPTIGCVYDQKVSSFLEYIGQSLYMDFDRLDAEWLMNAIDKALTTAASPEAAILRLHEIESRNTQAAREMIERA